MTTAADLQFGPYLVERELGRGAFGVVYKAARPADPDTPVALKVLQVRGRLDRLRLEPELLARLDHPNIVRVVDTFPHADGAEFVIALEYVGGGDLKAAIDQADRFGADAVRDLLAQVGGALAEAHKKGVVHRDLKPANILLDRSADGGTRYVLTDFGVGGADEGLRSVKKLAGTLLFMAPEQLRGRPGPQSDLWALGVTAYRMLTGVYPFPGPTADELSRQIGLTTPPPPDSGDPDLDRAVLRLLDRNETERIGSADDLLRELGVEKAGKRSGAATRTHRPASTAGREGSLDDALRRGVRRQYAWAGVWVGLLLLAASNPLSGLFVLAGLVLFYDAHRRRAGRAKAAQIAGAFVLVPLPTLVRLGVAEIEGRPLGATLAGGSTTLAEGMAWLAAAAGRVSPPLGQLVTGFTPLVAATCAVVLPVLACSSYARANRLRRERLLLSASARGTPAEYRARLRAELDYRFEDVGFHLKYAEALAAGGDHRAAAVEARLLLDQDPYHFGGNLLLADSYRRLGLDADAARVCDDYLAVSGYCFEFAELRAQCRPGGGVK